MAFAKITRITPYFKKTTDMSEGIDQDIREECLLGTAKLNTGNRVLHLSILDRGHGPIIRWSEGATATSDSVFEVETEAEALEHFLYLCVYAADNEQGLPESNMVDPPKIEIHKKADLPYDSFTLGNANGTVTIGFNCDPYLHLYIEADFRGVPTFKTRVSMQKEHFLRLLPLFFHTIRCDLSSPGPDAFLVTEESWLLRHPTIGTEDRAKARLKALLRRMS